MLGARGTVPAYGVSLFLARPRLASEGVFGGPETGAVPYSVGGTVPAYGVSLFLARPRFAAKPRVLRTC
jgi:hypothetical protein